MNKRILALSLVFILLLTAAAGCAGNKGAQSNGASTAAPATSAATTKAAAAAEKAETTKAADAVKDEKAADSDGGYVFSTPFVTSPVTVNWALYENPDTSHPYADHLPCFQIVEEITGVHIAVEAAVVADYDNAMKTRLAAGIDLPDVITIPGGATDQTKYVNAGLFIKLDDLIAKFAPHLSAWYAERPDLRGYLVSPDGFIYSIATSVEARSMLNYTNPGLRYDWLEKLGKDVPSTIDDLHDILTAFKNGDPNGNGEADEIPVIGKYDTVCYSLGWSYGLHLTQSKGWYYDDNDKVVYDWITDGAREWAAEMAKWYSEGLFDPDFTSPQADKYNAQALGDIAGMAQQMSMMYPQWTNRMAEEYPQAKWKAMMPVKAEGHKPFIEREFPYSNYYAITKDCKDPELNIKLIDWMMASKDGELLLNFGREGIEYTMVNGEPIFTDNVMKYERGPGLALQMLGINGSTPLILHKRSVEQRFLIYPDECAMSELSETFKIPCMPKIIATGEEAETLSRVLADINTYCEESVVKFITGATPLSEWDSFVAAIEGMGISEAIAIKQKQLDRFNASMR